jgi:hypothetical protein
LPSDQTGIEYKKENRTLSISPIKKKTKTTVKLLTGPYPVTNVNKNGTIRIQKVRKELYQKE